MVNEKVNSGNEYDLNETKNNLIRELFSDGTDITPESIKNKIDKKITLLRSEGEDNVISMTTMLLILNQILTMAPEDIKEVLNVSDRNIEI